LKKLHWGKCNKFQILKEYDTHNKTKLLIKIPENVGQNKPWYDRYFYGVENIYWIFLYKKA